MRIRPVTGTWKKREAAVRGMRGKKLIPAAEGDTRGDGRGHLVILIAGMGGEELNLSIRLAAA